MHENMEICLNIGLKCHKGPTKIHIKQMGDSPIKILKKNLPKNKVPNPFFEKFPILKP